MYKLLKVTEQLSLVLTSISLCSLTHPGHNPKCWRRLDFRPGQLSHTPSRTKQVLNLLGLRGQRLWVPLPVNKRSLLVACGSTWLWHLSLQWEFANPPYLRILFIFITRGSNCCFTLRWVWNNVSTINRSTYLWTLRVKSSHCWRDILGSWIRTSVERYFDCLSMA